MGIIGAFAINYIANLYEMKLERIYSEHESQISQFENELEKEEIYSEMLEEQIYNIMEGNEYSVSIEYDGVYYDYERKCNGNFLGIDTYKVSRTVGVYLD